MDMLPQKFNINTALPQNQISEKAESNKHKSSHKLNVSDYFVNKKKVMKKLSQKFTDLIIFDNKKVTNNKEKYSRRSSFTFRPQIKKELLKDYKEQIKMKKNIEK